MLWAGLPLFGSFSIEKILVILAILFGLFYLSIRVRKYATYLKESGAKGFGATMIVLGALLFVVAQSGVYKLFTAAIAKETFLKFALWLVIFGVAFIVVDWILQKLKKKELLGLEEERRDYITRVRKGIKIEDAEKIALDTVKRKFNPPGLKIIASEKEFKLWNVYLKDGIGKKYKVALDVEGEVQTWETMDELPSYMEGPN